MPNVKSLDLNLSLKTNNKDLYIKLNGQQHSLKESNIFPLTIKSMKQRTSYIPGFSIERSTYESYLRNVGDVYYKQLINLK